MKNRIGLFLGIFSIFCVSPIARAGGDIVKGCLVQYQDAIYWVKERDESALEVMSVDVAKMFANFAARDAARVETFRLAAGEGEGHERAILTMGMQEAFMMPEHALIPVEEATRQNIVYYPNEQVVEDPTDAVITTTLEAEHAERTAEAAAAGNKEDIVLDQAEQVDEAADEDDGIDNSGGGCCGRKKNTRALPIGQGSSH